MKDKKRKFRHFSRIQRSCWHVVLYWNVYERVVMFVVRRKKSNVYA
ncbi:hypothetical protein HMPREF3190_01655 [Umbribacter vaginalis]|nr:hypothetical protein HMPREF3190_01655 [Coriobacteriales bacterium DNF00809]